MDDAAQQHLHGDPVAGAGAALATGRHVSNEGDGRVSYVARADCAAVAAAVLTTAATTARSTTSPARRRSARTTSPPSTRELGGRPVEAVLVDDEAYAAGLVEHAGMPEPVARAYTTFGIGSRRGYSAPVSTTVADLTGGSPRRARGARGQPRAVLDDRELVRSSAASSACRNH